MTIHVKDGGSWKEVSALHVKDGGSWKEVTSAYVRDGGSWKLFYSSGSGSAAELTGMAITASVGTVSVQGTPSVDWLDNSYSYYGTPNAYTLYTANYPYVGFIGSLTIECTSATSSFTLYVQRANSGTETFSGFAEGSSTTVSVSNEAVRIGIRSIQCDAVLDVKIGSVVIDTISLTITGEDF